MSTKFAEFLENEISSLHDSGLYKKERIILTPQSAEIKTSDGKEVVNFCANNYLGLANSKELIAASKEALDDHGFGMASVRFICGTQDLHKDLEAKISKFLGMEDTILYSSCFDANAGLFETLLGPEDAIISDELNHASIIDGVRLCKAKRLRYRNNDMADLEAKLKESEGSRFRMIATDGVFSMDGIIANLADIRALADKYQALLMVDDSHAVGFMGEQGRGTPEYCGIKADILTGTLGKALGGASGGYTSSSKVIVDWLRNRSRPYLFSNSLAPMIVGASLKVIELLAEGGELRECLHRNTHYFREAMSGLGFNIIKSTHPIVPVMLGDAKVASDMADKLLQEGIYVIGFSYPVVPKDKARIRVQVSAGHSQNDLDKAIKAFEKVGKLLKVI